MYKFGLERVLQSAVANMKSDVLQKWGHLVSAQPVSACSGPATKNVWMDRGEETKAPPQRQGSSTEVGADICTGAEKLPPKMEPPLEKRAKRGAGEEEREEGEVSSDEEDTNQNEIVLSPENYDERSSLKDMEDVDESGRSSRDRCLGEALAESDEASASREATEVTMTKEDSAKEPETVRSVPCRHGNESAHAADSCQME